MEKSEKCCICKKSFKGYGNNPWPLKEEGVCCNECNAKVLFARLDFSRIEKELEKKRKQAEYHKQYNLRKKSLK